MRYISILMLLVATPVAANQTLELDRKNSPMTQGNVQLNVKVGQTNKAEVLEAFGAPNVTTRDGAGLEVWSYQRHATVSQSKEKSGFWTILFAGGGNKTSGFSQTMRTMTLIIKFDSGDIVRDFRSRTSDF